jgi:hypothetical protein
MPSIQATLSEVNFANQKGFSIQLSPVGGIQNQGNAKKIRFRLNKTLTGLSANSATVTLTASGNYVANGSSDNIINPSSPLDGVTLSQFSLNDLISSASSPVLVETAVSSSSVLFVDVQNALVTGNATMIIELLNEQNVVLDSASVEFRSSISSQPLGYRLMPNEASAISSYVSSVPAIFNSLLKAQKGSILVFTRKDDSPVRLFFTEPIQIESNIETHALSNATIAKPFNFSFEFKSVNLAKEYIDFVYSLQRDGVVRANQIPSLPPIFEVQIETENFIQVVQNVSFVPLIQMNLNGADVNSENNFIGGRFSKVITVEEFFSGFYVK